MNYYKELAKARRILRERPSVRVVCLTKDGAYYVPYGAWFPCLDEKVYFPVSRYDFEECGIKSLAGVAREILEG
jgi:hypothetical protein